MEFRLIYEGPLRGQGAKSTHKWEIRRALHPQLRRLWHEQPLRDSADTLLAFPPVPSKVSVVVEKGGLLFAPLVTQRLNLYVELSVLLFRQQPRGTLITDGGDIDNRLKTLLDGLRVPHGSMEGRTELPSDPDPRPFFCLLEDDSLVTKVSVESEQLLRPAKPDEVVAIIGVHVKKTLLSHANMSL
ncbi:MAG: hypothetical protein MUF08_13615 [Burkholderiaceae bacterium]|jgi:hypothetical protein|nr:hypothetical protein [Burkholderiaceae bacterium]MCU0966054.1 hypothetical protein [Burkholderiaceae bacterium]